MFAEPMPAWKGERKKPGSTKTSEASLNGEENESGALETQVGFLGVK